MLLYVYILLFITGRPGLHPTAVLDVMSEAEVGRDYMPSMRYPSDHLAIAADFELIWEQPLPPSSLRRRRIKRTSSDSINGNSTSSNTDGVYNNSDYGGRGIDDEYDEQYEDW